MDITTSGANGAPIATGRGGGTVTVTGGTVVASGQDSPGIYSTGVITIDDATITATGAESAVIEGGNSISLTKTDLVGSKGTRDRGIMVYQSMFGDAAMGGGTFTMTGGSYDWTSTIRPGILRDQHERDDHSLGRGGHEQRGRAPERGRRVLGNRRVQRRDRALHGR